MSNGSNKRDAKRIKPGLKPETVKIEGDWKDAVKKALDKKPEPKEPDEDGNEADPEHYCTHCGARLVHGDHFCPKCGRMVRPG